MHLHRPFRGAVASFRLCVVLNSFVCTSVVSLPSLPFPSLRRISPRIGQRELRKRGICTLALAAFHAAVQQGSDMKPSLALSLAAPHMCMSPSSHLIVTADVLLFTGSLCFYEMEEVDARPCLGLSCAFSSSS